MFASCLQRKLLSTVTSLTSLHLTLSWLSPFVSTRTSLASQNKRHCAHVSSPSLLLDITRCCGVAAHSDQNDQGVAKSAKLPSGLRLFTPGLLLPLRIYQSGLPSCSHTNILLRRHASCVIRLCLASLLEEKKPLVEHEAILTTSHPSYTLSNKHKSLTAWRN